MVPKPSGNGSYLYQGVQLSRSAIADCVGDPGSRPATAGKDDDDDFDRLVTAASFVGHSPQGQATSNHPTWNSNCVADSVGHQPDTSTLLNLAEQLLSSISKCIKAPSPMTTAVLPATATTAHVVIKPPPNIPIATTAVSDGSMGTPSTLLPGRVDQQPLSIPPPDMHPALPMHSYSSRDVDSHMTQIEWLLRGLPEAYDSEPYYDDEAVEAILKEGGSPPNQLQLPSVHAINQHILSKLSSSNVLRVRFTNLLVFSSRYGIRKEGTYLLIHPPTGTTTPSNESKAALLPLVELEDSSYKASQILRRNSKKDSIRNYFVGSVALVDKCVDFNLAINDHVMKEWIKGTVSGCIQVELFGYLAPRDSMVRGRMVEPVCIGTM